MVVHTYYKYKMRPNHIIPFSYELSILVMKISRVPAYAEQTSENCRVVVTSLLPSHPIILIRAKGRKKRETKM